MMARLLLALMLLIPAEDALNNQLARDIYKELIEINTTGSVGNTTTAAQAIAVRLRNAGFPAVDIQVLGPDARKGNLVARYRGTGRRKPLLLLAHLDVVEAAREDWSVDPFKFIEKDGYFWGRGTTDDKAMAAAWIAAFIRLRQEHYVPDRDLIVALTADEESGNANGVQWLLGNHKDLIDAEFAFNEGGESEIKDGRYLLNTVQLSEKVYQSFRLEVRNAGGHSSRPVKDNAIYHLAEGLTRLARFEFPAHVNGVTIAYYQRMASLYTGQVAADMRAVAKNPPDRGAVARLSKSPQHNALLHTTCVATRLEAGNADNALPQNARATVNCRILPGESPMEVKSTLDRVLADPKISVSPIDEAIASEPSTLNPEILGAIERTTTQMWPGVPLIPVMSTGATDGLYLRNAGIPTYGVSGFFEDLDDTRAHGRDERMGVKQFYEGREFLYRLVKAVSS
ncbi:MAG TPA: M20/M25/M40 family metallo-hydrolase [Terriglobia bacterium]|jgi:acetylornithine deacetylase/succinyl-diaminopimelate desuccinylase-like protein